jgi:uncharacterized integral membrane protein
MQVIRTVIWVLVAVALLLFSINNWQDVEVKIWEDLILQTKLPALVIFSFLLGLLPMWLLSKAGRWRLTRRINSLENSIKAAVTGNPHAVGTSTQLDAGPTDTQAN